MKNIISILLVGLMLAAFCACGSNNEETVVETETDNKPEKIQLTVDNILDYITISGIYKTSDIYNYYPGGQGGDGELNLSAYTFIPGVCNNVEIILNATNMGDWHIDGNDYEEWRTICIKMPSNGNLSSLIPLHASSFSSISTISGIFEFEIVSVNGTFTPNE